MASNQNETRPPEKAVAGDAPPTGTPTQTHVPAWKVLLIVGIILALMIIGGFLLRD